MKSSLKFKLPAIVIKIWDELTPYIQLLLYKCGEISCSTLNLFYDSLTPQTQSLCIQRIDTHNMALELKLMRNSESLLCQQY